MFDIFGEFNSAEEINEAAAAQLQDGDTDAVMTIARENGIDADEMCIRDSTSDLWLLSYMLTLNEDVYKRQAISGEHNLSTIPSI